MVALPYSDIAVDASFVFATPSLLPEYGKATNELFTQFIARVAKEIPTATIAMFSTLKYVNATNFEKFREVWSAKYLGGFVVHSKAFDGLNGNFLIGFLIWKTNNTSLRGTKQSITTISTDVLDKNSRPIGEKVFYNLPNSIFLSNWFERPKINKEQSIPLKNTVTPATSQASKAAWSESAIGHFLCDSNDMQNAPQATALFSSVHGIGHKGGCFVNSNNLWQVGVSFTVRQLIKHSWLNHNDQFLQPTGVLTEEFKSDCLIWMLFNGKNLTASANNLEWNGKKWSIVNHFIPFTEEEVGSPERFESDFMVEYLVGTGRDLSLQSKEILKEGKKLWQAYFAHTDVHSVREELKLNRPDVGWYQVRNALKKRNESGDFAPVNFKPFEEAYKALTEKLQPMVYELGFLKV